MVMRSSAHFIQKCQFSWISLASTILVILIYFTSGVGLTCYNKWILGSQNFHYPFLLISCHFTMNFILMSLTIRMCMLDKLKMSDFWISRINLRTYVTTFIPIGILFGCDIVFTNRALEFSSASFTEIIKSGIPIIVALSGCVLYGEAVSSAKIFVILLLSFGIILTTLSELSFKFPGFVAALIGMVSGSAKLLLMERALGGSKKVPSMLLLFYLTPIATMFLLGPFIMFELEEVVDSKFFDADHYLGTTINITVGSVMAFVFNVSEFLILARTSALTLCVCGICKLVVVIVVTTFAFDHELSRTNKIGIAITITAVVMYNIQRRIELKRNLGTPHHMPDSPFTETADEDTVMISMRRMSAVSTTRMFNRKHSNSLSDSEKHLAENREDVSLLDQDHNRDLEDVLVQFSDEDSTSDN
eukprot:960296_1